MSRRPLAVALVHHPVVDRRGDAVSTAVTNLDLHDIARSCRTYGVGRFYVVTPVPGQQLLVERILEHWCRGFGAEYNPDRAEALSLIETVPSLDVAMDNWQRQSGMTVRPVLTGAGRNDGITTAACRAIMEQESPLLIFGTGGGLAPQFFERGWTVLEPIRGGGDYNHLSVRAAAAIILDRLLGQ